MSGLFAQGDLLIERVPDSEPSGANVAPDENGLTVLAEGEKSGHRHAIEDRVVFFRDDQLARDIPSGLYIGHLKVPSEPVMLRHEEHDTIALPPGTYRVRRQRQLEPQDAVLVLD